MKEIVMSGGSLVPLCGYSVRSVRRNVAAKRHKKRKIDEPPCIAKLKCVSPGAMLTLGTG